MDGNKNPSRWSQLGRVPEEAGPSAAAPETAGRILFARLGDFPPTGIMSVKPDGTDFRQLLDRGDSPKASPDGTRIAFSNGCDDGTDLAALDPKSMLHSMKPEFFFTDEGTRRMGRGTKPGIFLMNADGTNVREFASAPDVGFTRPIWSPDGSRIAFLGTRKRSTSVWIANADGSGPRQLTPDGHYSYITWMDSTRLAGVRYASLNSSESWMAAIDCRTGRAEKLDVFQPGDLDPSWSPDGRKVTFTKGSDLHVMNADGGDLLSLGDGMVPAWSPDGGWITFSSRKRSRMGAEVFIVRPDGTDEKRLTDTTPPQKDKIVEDWDPCWGSQ